MVGTWAGGLDRLNKSGERIKNYSISGERGTGNNNITVLFEDNNGEIWIGTAGSGLFYYHEKTDEFIQVLDRISTAPIINTAFVTSILEDVDGRYYWIGTLYGLVNMQNLRHGNFRFSAYFHNESPKSLSSNAINTIFIDRDQNLWFGTDKGLNRYNRKYKTFTVFQKHDGLPNNSIKGILEDAEGHLWISTNRGISSYNPGKNLFKNFSTDDGLNSDEFYPRSCIRTRKGELFFGGNNGFNTFIPDSFVINNFIPPYTSQILNLSINPLR